MAFTTFKYELLVNNILNLSKSYSTHIGRYSIVDNQVDTNSATPVQTPLGVLIARVDEKLIQCKTDRETARNVFSQLRNELKPFINDPSKMRNGTFFLLGALIHRYFRIIAEYDLYNNSRLNLFSYFKKETWNINDCRLYVVIKEVLQLDTKTLDELTIINALEVFRENMFMEVSCLEKENKEEVENKVKKAVKKPRYQTYLHFATQDPYFKEHLDEMILTHQKKGEFLIKQFRGPSFLQSLAIQLEKDKEPVTKEIVEWCKSLSKDHHDFKILTQEVIQRHFKNYFKSKPEEIRNRVSDLLSMGFEPEKFKDVKDHAEFVELLNTFNTYENLCILCGGYVLLLKRGNLDKDLYTIIEKALGLQTEMSNEDMLNCINLLQTFVEKNPAPSLNCEIFGTKNLMVTQVSQLSVALEQAVKEQNRTTVLSY